MKEMHNEKGLYTEAEFDQVIEDDKLRAEGHEPEEPVEDLDPLSDKNVHAVNAITLMRIYDVLCAILTEMDEDAATALLEAHQAGKLIGSLPYVNMDFSTEEKNVE